MTEQQDRPTTLNTQPQASWRDILQSGNASKAYQTYLLTEDTDEDTRNTLSILADVQTLLREKSWDQALRKLDRHDATNLMPNWSDLKAQVMILEKSAKALDHRDSEEALELLQGVTVVYLLAEAECQRGTAHIFLNEVDKAKACFTRALEIDPKHCRALTNVGNLALEEDRVDDAIEAYEEALKYNDDFANAYHNLGVAYRRKGQYGKSIQHLKKAQSALSRKQREDSRQALGDLTRTRGVKVVRWALYAVAAVIVYIVLQRNGVL